MNQKTLASVVLLAMYFCLSCDRADSKTNRGVQKSAPGGGSAGSEPVVLYRGHLPSRAAVDAVPWASPAHKGSNTLLLDGPVGKVDVWFEEGEHLDVTARTVSFLQQNGELSQMDVALDNMDKEEAANALDQLATAWGMDKTRLIRWREAGKPDFPTTGFFVENTRPLHFTTVEIGPSFDDQKPYVVHFNYGWKSQDDLERIKRGR